MGISNDALKLRRDYGLCCAGLLDLSQLAACALADGARPWCLAELCERVLRRRLRKCAELRTGSNWAAAQLTAEQLECAAHLQAAACSPVHQLAVHNSLQPCASEACSPMPPGCSPALTPCAQLQLDALKSAAL